MLKATAPRQLTEDEAKTIAFLVKYTPKTSKSGRRQALPYDLPDEK